MFTMAKKDLLKVFARFSDKKIGVIGDFALDGYWTVVPDAALPSLETGKPTLPVSHQRYTAGAAGNVVSALTALGCTPVSVFGVIGKDPWGTHLQHILENLNADRSGLICQEQDWTTVAYVKPHISGTEQNRMDFGDFNQLHDATAHRLLSALRKALPELDAVVINAQARAGIHNALMKQGLQQIIEEHPNKLFIVDSREPETMYAGAVLKINNLELAKVHISSKGSNPVHDALAMLYAEREKTVFVTCGEEGVLVGDANGITQIEGIKVAGPIDTTGAGDATMAGMTAALACKASPAEAAFIGNLAAAVCVRKVNQTGTASPDEMLALYQQSASLQNHRLSSV